MERQRSRFQIQSDIGAIQLSDWLTIGGNQLLRIIPRLSTNEENINGRK
jgi:hypothetical protein